MWTIAAVGLRRYLRDRSSIFFVFVLPFLIIFLVGAGSGAAGGSSIGVVAQDVTASQRVITHLPSDQVEQYATADAAIRAVENNQIAAAVLFSTAEADTIDFIARPGVGRDARALLEEAAAVENQRLVLERQAAKVGATAEQIADAVLATPSTPISVETIGQVIWAGLDSFEASSLTQVILFTFLSSLTAASFLVQDRELGMARRKASAPVSPLQIVLGETLSRFYIAAFQAALIVSATALLFGVDWGNPVSTGLVLVLFALVATGAGVLLGSALDNAEAASGAGIMIGLVLAALGGAMAPVEIYPDVMQTVAKFTPHYWAIDGLKTSLAGGSIADILRPIGVLAATAAGLLLASTWFYQHKVYGRRVH